MKPIRFTQKLFVLLIALMASVASFAYNFKAGDFYYTVTSRAPYTVEVACQFEENSDYDNYYQLPENITIPDSIHRGTYTYAVTAIGEFAFHDCKTLKSVIIPNTIKEIKNAAFKNCSSLTSVNIPNTIKEIKNSAFKNCTSLTSVTLSDSVRFVQSNVFSGCKSLVDINLPSDLRGIGERAFQSCTALKTITIPKSVTSIGGYAFAYCHSLVPFDIPDNITSIQGGTFYGCKSFTSYVVPNHVTSIGPDAFADCSALNSITLHHGITKIAEDAFNDCSKMTSIIFAMNSIEECCTNHVNQIISEKNRVCGYYNTCPYRTFLVNGTKIKDLLIPSTVDSVSEYAFAKSYITSVTVADGVKYIPPTAFQECPSLRSVTWNVEAFADVPSKENAPFSQLNKNNQVQSFTFGKDVEHIPAYLCYDMSGLDSIIIPASVKSIGRYAFAGTSPTSVISYATEVPEIGVGAFQEVLYTTLYVPAESVEQYKNAELWKDFGEILAIGETKQEDWDLMHDFVIDNFAYKIIQNAETPSVALIEAIGHSGHVDIPAYVTHNDTTYQVTTLGTGIFASFAKCPNMTSVYIPKNTVRINNAIFSGCKNLASIEVDEDNPYYDSRDNCNAVVWSESPMALIAGCNNSTIPEGVEFIYQYAFKGSDLKEIEIPNSVTKIASSAFSYCSSLSSVIIGNGVTSIEDWSFSYCTNLKKVICLATTPPYLGSYAFMGTPLEEPDPAERISIYVPDLSVDIYRNRRPWSNYNIQPINGNMDYKAEWTNQWNIITHEGLYDNSQQFWQYNLAQDTIIGDYTYTIVTRQPIEATDSLNAPKPEYVAAVRFTEDKKVYIFYDDTEYLLYDFGAAPGDAFNVFAGINNYPTIKTRTVVVSGRKFIPHKNDYTKQQLTVRYVDKNAQINYYTIWEDYVGATEGFLMAPRMIRDDNNHHLLCAYHNDSICYATDDEVYMQYDCGNNPVGNDTAYPKMLSGLQRTEFEEYSKGYQEEENTSSLLTFNDEVEIDGTKYLKVGLWSLREEDGKILVYSHIQKKDLVLYDFTLGVGDILKTLNIDFYHPNGRGIVDYSLTEGNVEKPIHTLVVKEVTKVTLLDGKEYKKWKFNNDLEYIEGLGNINADFFMLALYNVPFPDGYIGTHLICANRNNRPLYMVNDILYMQSLGATCLCGGNNFEDNAKEGKLGGRPTPTQWYQLYEKTQMMKLRSANANNNNSIESAETFVYELLSDTMLINEKKYLPLICSATQDNVDSTSYVGALHFSKEDKVYFHYNDTEYLLYDFGAQVGDTLELFAGVENYHNQQTYTHVVTHKDTLSDGRTIITLNTLLYDDQQTEQRHKTVWIAGVGSLDGIVHNSATLVKNDHATTMLCAWLDDECVYTTDLPFYKSLGCIYNNNAETSVENIEIPTKNEGDKFLRNGQLFILHNGRTYNVFGVLVK